MAKRKRKNQRSGCATLILIVIVLAAGIFIGRYTVRSAPDNGFVALISEYADRAKDAVKKKLGGIGMSKPQVTTTYEWEDPSYVSGEFRETEDVDYTVNRLLYDTLSEDGKYAYDALYSAVLEHTEKVFIPTMSESELSDVHAALKYDNPQLPCFSDEFSYGSLGGICYVKLQYAYTKEACAEAAKTMITEARKICASCRDLDEYSRVLAIHDALIERAHYGDSDIFSHNAAGTLVYKEGVCASYVLAMKLMLDISGIRSCVIRGDVEGDEGTEPHVWLAIEIDGQWYETDPTWDDPTNDENKDYLVHAYLNVPDADIRKDHLHYTLPAFITCDQTDANYFVRNGAYASADDWQQVVTDVITAGFTEEGCDVELKFENAEVYDEAVGWLSDGGINGIVTDIVQDRYDGVTGWITSTQAFETVQTVHYIITTK